MLRACAKALNAITVLEAVPPSSKVPDESQSFLAASRFLALAACDPQGAPMSVQKATHRKP